MRRSGGCTAVRSDVSPPHCHTSSALRLKHMLWTGNPVKKVQMLAMFAHFCKETQLICAFWSSCQVILSRKSPLRSPAIRREPSPKCCNLVLNLEGRVHNAITRSVLVIWASWGQPTWQTDRIQKRRRQSHTSVKSILHFNCDKKHLHSTTSRVRGSLKAAVKLARRCLFNADANFFSHGSTHLSGDSNALTDGENDGEKNRPKFSFQRRKDSTFSVFPLFVLTCRYLAGDVTNRREERQESQEYGEKCIHVVKRGRLLSLKQFSPRGKVFLLRVSPSSPPSSLFFSSLFCGLLFLLMLWIQPLHSLLSPVSLFSLPTGSRGHYTLFHAEWGSARERQRASEREREREGARAQQRECDVTRQQLIEKKNKLKNTGTKVDFVVMSRNHFLFAYVFFTH